MTQSTSKRGDTAQARITGRGSPDLGEPGLIRGVQVFTALATLAGVGISGWTLAHDEWRWAVVGLVLVLLGGMGGVVWLVHLIMADRQSFYQRGLLDGWMRGWRGEEPGADPLLKPRQ